MGKRQLWTMDMNSVPPKSCDKKCLGVTLERGLSLASLFGRMSSDPSKSLFEPLTAMLMLFSFGIESFHLKLWRLHKA